MQRRAESLAFARIDFDQRTRDRDAITEVVQEPGTYRQLNVTRYAAGGLWVYATTLHDGWGDHQYFVFNPDTGALLHFVPEVAITDLKRHTYASKPAQIQGTAAGMGVAGGHLETGFAGLALGGFAGAGDLEAGGYYWGTKQPAPTASRPKRCLSRPR